MRRRRLAAILLAAAAVLIAADLLRAGELRLDRLEHLSGPGGLPRAWVLAVYQDRQGFLWIGTHEGLYRYDGYHFKAYRHDPEDPDSISNSYVWRIYEDRSGNLWLATQGGLNRFDRAEERFTHYRHDPEAEDSLSHDVVCDVHEDRSGALWVATVGGLNRLDRGSPERGPLPGSQKRRGNGRFVRFHHDPEDPDSLGHDTIAFIHESRSGVLWFGSYGPLNRLDPSGKRFVRVPVLEEEDPQRRVLVGSIAEDAEGRLWLGTYGDGVLLLDPDTGKTVRYLHDPGDPSSLSDDRIQTLHLTRDGHLWIGTVSQGLNLFDPATETFSAYRHDPDEPGSLSDNRISALWEDSTGVLWIGTGLGLDKLDKARERFALYRHKPGDPSSLSGDQVRAVYGDAGGALWVGTANSGLNRLEGGPPQRSASGRSVTARYRHDPDDPGSLTSDRLLSLLVDSDGTLWIGTDQGLDWLDGERFGHLTHDPEDPESLIPGAVYSIVEGPEGVLWIAGGHGLSRLEKAGMRLRTYRREPDNPDDPLPRGVYVLRIDRRGDLWIGMMGGALGHVAGVRDGGPPGPEAFRNHQLHPGPGSTSILALHEDSSGALWIGFDRGGLGRFDRHREGPDGDRFTLYREKHGLPNDSIYAILEADAGYLWLSTFRGLARFDPQNETFESYGAEDGLQGDVFGLSAAWRSPRGELFFGGPAGLNAFFPDRIAPDPHPPPVAITDFLLFNRPTPFAARLSPAGGPEDLPRLVLGYRDEVFAFEFAALHFAKPAKNRYAYQLVGFNDDWIETDAEKRFAEYTNLDAGTYTFRVKASNGDGVWNEAGTAIEVMITPPPWKTWWAWSLYGLALAALVLGYLRWQHRRVERERAVSRRLRAVDKLKDEFLANTSHELRTPLYGIAGLAESLIDGARGEVSEEVRADLMMIVSSGRRLSHLVNDILDFSKLRHHSLELDRKPVDLHALVDVVLTLSRPLVGAKDLELLNAVPPELPPADADENRLQQILHNLVGNAIKFTESGSVEVAATARADELTVGVRDTGIGIPEDDQERIFEAFAQGEGSTEREFGGTGLGLAVTRQLVALHGGTLGVESAPDEGSTFFFTLPTAPEGPDLSPEPAARVARPAEVESAALGISAEPAQTRVTPEGSARILVVDDEPVNRQVLVNQLAAQGYEIRQAASGPEALAAIDRRPADLVLLDVMMPRMSGYEVCRTLRQRFPLDELPVIFLTAKGQVSDLLVGLAAGANDYLPKPISRSELLARVRTHLALLRVHRKLSQLVTERTAQLAERQRLLEERERLIGELEARNAEMARFNYTIAHDLRNPLVTITNFLGLLRRDASAGRAESLEHDLERLEAAADQMRQLLEDLFAFSHAGVRIHPAAAVPLGELVGEALEELSGAIAERGVVVEVEEDLPTVRGDRAQLREVVRHLLDNAVKYLGDQPAPRIEVGLQRDGEDDVFYVRDNGQGVEAQYHDKIFGLFERLDTGSEGTGVGLALAKRVVKAHGGRIWVESEGREQGSTFRFTLPSP